MPRTETELLNDLGTASFQDLHNARLNPFAVDLLVEAYRLIVKETGKTHVFRFAFDGVAITLQPFVPGTQPAMQRNEEGEHNLPAPNEADSSLMTALQESLKLQSHYAKLLNAHDGGQRVAFESVDQWLKRLDELRVQIMPIGLSD